MRPSLRLALLLALALLAGCPGKPTWQLVHHDLRGALLSVWGTSSHDVWAVGGDTTDGMGPLVIHFDGTSWTRVQTGQTDGSLWWVFGFDGGPIYMGGEGGRILRYAGGTFTLLHTPSSTVTVFGIWGASPDDLWAVGGNSSADGGFAWRLRGGDTWTPESTLPADVPAAAAIWKVYGTSANEAWLVGSNGVSLHWDGTALAHRDTGVTGASLFTVHARNGRYAAVGGSANAIIVETDASGTWHSAALSDSAAPALAGVCLGAGDTGFAVGEYGAVYSRSSGGWDAEDLGFPLAQNLHGVWIDPDGGVWAVGGHTFAPPLVQGVLIHRGNAVATGGI